MMTPIGIYLNISRSFITESEVIRPWAIFLLLSLNNELFNRLLEVSVFLGEYQTYLIPGRTMIVYPTYKHGIQPTASLIG